MNALIFKEIEDEHLQEVLDIYNYYVINTTISFHTEPISLDEIRENVIFNKSIYKSFIVFKDDKITGYVLVNQHKKKQAYDVSGEVTIYLKPEYVGQGIGGQALTFIEKFAKDKGFHVLIATICKENDNSKYLFEKYGYSQCAYFREVGYKFGRRLDIVTYQKIIDNT
jgi:L-amino acid N-acyltransferase YncA